jgi:hypothetical protein
MKNNSFCARNMKNYTRRVRWAKEFFDFSRKEKKFSVSISRSRRAESSSSREILKTFHRREEGRREELVRKRSLNGFLSSALVQGNVISRQYPHFSRANYLTLTFFRYLFFAFILIILVWACNFSVFSYYTRFFSFVLSFQRARLALHCALSETLFATDLNRLFVLTV